MHSLGSSHSYPSKSSAQTFLHCLSHFSSNPLGTIYYHDMHKMCCYPQALASPQEVEVSGGVKISSPPPSPSGFLSLCRPKGGLRAASTTMVLANSESAMFQHALELDGELSWERTKVDKIWK
ncbi:hypothetical protein LIER_38856 [Lithospermum erythrorhizon]|uniref:Uncharacterized protein n=1 Tax=Lithospermum erythrorhizon TaxID=34254 RepID=A0AAV3Q7H0_LITER